MEIEKGKMYLCTKTVVMDNLEVDYVKGQLYQSEHNGCITDEQGCERHKWPSGRNPEEYFELFGEPNLLPIFFTAEQLKLIENVFDSELRERQRQYSETKENERGFLRAGCPEEKYNSFLEMAGKKVSELSEVLQTIRNQREEYEKKHNGKD